MPSYSPVIGLLNTCTGCTSFSGASTSPRSSEHSSRNSAGTVLRWRRSVLHISFTLERGEVAQTLAGSFTVERGDGVLLHQRWEKSLERCLVGSPRPGLTRPHGTSVTWDKQVNRLPLLSICHAHCLPGFLMVGPC